MLVSLSSTGNFLAYLLRQYSQCIVPDLKRSLAFNGSPPRKGGGLMEVLQVRWEGKAENGAGAGLASSFCFKEANIYFSFLELITSVVLGQVTGAGPV